MTADWSIVPLSSVAAAELRNGVFKKKTEFGRGTLLVNVSDVFRGLLVDPATLDRVNVTPEEQSRFSALAGDVLFVRSSLKKEGLAYSCVVNSTNEPLVFECHLIRVRPDLSKVDPLFLGYFTHSTEFRQEVMSHAKTVAITTIGQDALGSVPVRLPPLLEQRKIAAILSSVDEAIEATHAVIGQLRIVKKAMMAELLTRGLPGRHTRFKETEIGHVPEEWEVVPLSEVAFVQTGIAKGKAVENGVELPYLRVANVQDGRVDLGEMKTILVEERSVERYSLRSGDVLFTEGGDADKLGRGCVWRGQINPCLHQNHVFAVRTDGARLQPEYLAYLAASPGGKAYFLDSAKQTTNLASINSTQLKAFPVPLASLDEQAQIVRSIAGVEGRSACEEACASQLRALKAALMSVLLTGEVRVKPDEEAA